MMMFKRKNTNVSLNFDRIQNDHTCNSIECTQQEDPRNKMAEAAYYREERWCSGYQVPLETWLQVEKEIDALVDRVGVLQIDNDF